MGIISNITGTSKPALGSTSTIKGGVLAPFRFAQGAIGMLFVVPAIAILWGMTFKPPDDQSWGVGDYAGVLLTSWGVSMVGGR